MMTPNHATGTNALADIIAAFGLLTRLPVPQTEAPRPDAAWAWPLAGAAAGALAALIASIALGLGLTPGIAAGLAVGAQAMLTGALHEDGLADTADGFFGGRTKERRLEIMKDSHIGSFGTLALVLITLMRWSALATIMAAGAQWTALIAAGALSRAPMAVLMAALPNARGTGLSHHTGQPTLTAALAAVALGFAIALITGFTAFGMVWLAGVVTLALGLYARAKIGGQTGDVLGASQQLADVAILAVVAAALA